ncbi:helix-turn-helix domain-containing protein [Microbacterium sp. NPDC089698]|uniref:helix-turn-helix domain-containing protein n=1 Tax=Microbacterium sp. NPDC089698 TaxID=3364200 RepID=UPI00382AA03A
MSSNCDEEDYPGDTDRHERLAGRRLDDLPELMTPEELSTYLQIPVRTLYYWNGRDEGPVPEKFGKHLRYPKENVIAWRRGLDRR